MKNRGKSVLAAILLSWCATNAMAKVVQSACPSTGFVSICTPASNSVGDSQCPDGSWCGATYTSLTNNLNFHGFTGSSNSVGSVAAALDSQNWLNSNNGAVSFSLCDTSGTNCYGQLVQGSNLWTSAPGTYYRAPLGTPKDQTKFPPPYSNPPTCDPNGTSSYACDNGYYLITTNGGGSITIQFGTLTKDQSGNVTSCSNCLSSIGFFWGSVDSYNTVTFTDVYGNTSTINGTTAFQSTQLASYNSVVSGVVYFSPKCGTNTWQSVSFSSSLPAFEFDNISYNPTTALSVGPCGGSPVGNLDGSDFGSVPTPEPATLPLLESGLVLVAAALRKRIRL